MLRPVYLVAFSGHRPDGSPGRTDGELLAAAPRIEQALSDLKFQVETCGGELQFIGSLAAGSDLIACRAAFRLGLPLHIILPMPEEEFFEKGFLEKDHLAAWKDPALRILAAVHPHAKLPPPQTPTHPEILPLTQADGSLLDLFHSRHHTFRILDSIGTENEDYVKANAEMLANADALISIYDGRPSKGPGGTADSINLAEKLNIPTIVINPGSGSVIFLRFSSAAISLSNKVY